MTHTVLILDFGAQYSQLIARRTRESGVYCEIVPYDTPWSALSLRNPDALILSGGPQSTLVEGAPEMDKEIVRAGVPILGICYGMQLLARDVGAELVQLDHAEYGPATLMVADRPTPLFDGVPEESRVWMSHGDSVVELPSGYLALASTARCHVAAMGNPKKKIYGVQFHPEVVHSEYGRTVLDNFLHQIAALGSDWAMESFLETSVREIRTRIGSDKAICAVVRTDPGLPWRRSGLVRVTQPCEMSATRDWPSENTTSRQGRPSITGVAATIVVGQPASSKT